MNPHHGLSEPSRQAHCRKGREGKGSRNGVRDVVPIHLQTVPARLGEWMAAAAAGRR